jgi:hypothetical protein
LAGAGSEHRQAECRVRTPEYVNVVLPAASRLFDAGTLAVTRAKNGDASNASIDRPRAVSAAEGKSPFLFTHGRFQPLDLPESTRRTKE